MDAKGIVLGYFFGPRRDSLPNLDHVRGLRAEDSITIAMFGHLGLTEETWTIIGRRPDWHPDAWPVPAFGRIDVFGEKAWRVRYHDPSLAWLADERIGLDEAHMLPRDGLLGSGAMESRISRLLPQATRQENGSAISDTVATGSIQVGAPADVAASILPSGAEVEADDRSTPAGPEAHAEDEDAQHAVQVFIPLSTDGMGTDEDWHWLEELEDQLDDQVNQEQVGELDGNEIGEGEWCLYLYGQNADALAATVLSVLRGWPVPTGSYLLKRYGDTGAAVVRIDL